MDRGTNSILALVHAALRRIESGCGEAELRAQLPSAIEAEGREQFGGQCMRVYWRKTPSTERAAREQRIEAALVTGEAPDSIAKREDVSKRHIRRIRARFA